MASYIFNRWTFLSVGIAVGFAYLYNHKGHSRPIPIRQHLSFGDMRRSAVVIGATGATGVALVEQLLRSNEWGRVTVIHRRPVDISAMNLDEDQISKLRQHTVEMEHLVSDEVMELFKGHDVTFCTLGTTRDVAGTADQFRKVDVQMVRDSAISSRKSGVGHFSLMSSQGANANVWACDWKICHPLLYMKSKGEAENAIIDLRFPRTSIFRPGLLDRGSMARGPERFSAKFLGSTSVSDVAAAMIYDAESTVVDGTEDPVIYEGNEVQSLAASS